MLVIAIDGPAGAGKSTIGRLLAARLGVEYLDTGAMYRGVAFGAMRAGVDLSDDAALAAYADDCVLEVGDAGVFVDGADATTAIRGPEVTSAVSSVATNSAVRVELVKRQREWAFAREGGVLEGRDIGTVVFPDATLKVYLTASPMERATRRAAESGGDVMEIARAIEARDHQDSTRADSPLRAADGAVTVDTTGRSIDDIVDGIIALLPASSTPSELDLP